MAKRVPVARRAIVVAAGFESALALLALALGWLCGVNPLSTLTWSPAGLAIGVAAALPMLVLFVLFTRSGLPAMERIRELLDEALGPMFAGASVTELAVVAIAAGIGEELLFRGFLQAWIEGWVGVWPALALASVVFGLAHPMTRAYVVIAAAFGAYLGWLWIRTGDLLAPIAAHAFYDFVAFVVLTRAVRERNELIAT